MLRIIVKVRRRYGDVEHIDWNKNFIRVEPSISVMRGLGVVGLKLKVRSTKSKNQDAQPCVFFA